ncbi:MAG TPA: hypothetical protein VIF43_04450 [Patescibacteria group bacterium]|jgi:hypothetical protein
MKDTYTKDEYQRDQAFAGQLCLIIGFLLGAIFATGTALMVVSTSSGDEEGKLFAIGCGLYFLGAGLALLCGVAIGSKHSASPNGTTADQTSGG